MPLGITLAASDGGLFRYRLKSQKPLPPLQPARFEKRIAFAAAHVVIDALRTHDPVLQPVIDFDATLAYRRHLWSLGFGVADAMDTAQRGMGLSWQNARELIRLSAREAKACGGAIACGANTDNLAASDAVTLDTVTAAYQRECEHIERSGAQVIMMASRALSGVAKGPRDYQDVYRGVLAGCSRPVILHWLGEAFDPTLRGYWGTGDLGEAMNICLEIIEGNRARIDGIKISLLDAQREIDMRRRLPAGIRMYTGDDFHYSELIAGDEHGYSDALLGIFDAIAPVVSAGLQALDRGEMETYRKLMDSTVPLSRHIFEAPTYFYKTGLVLLAYLNGHQNHFRMLGGQESMRSVPHVAKLFMLADAAGLLQDPEAAVHRMEKVLSLGGVP